PDFPQDRAQLQPADGDRSEDLRRRGRGNRARRQPRPRLHPPARHLCEAPRPWRALRQEDRIPHHAFARDRLMRGLALAAPLLLAGCASAPAEVATAPAAPPAEAAKPPVALQYLYGSPEAAVAVRATNARIRS